MPKTAPGLLIAAITLYVASCGFTGSSGTYSSPPIADSILTFQSDAERLALPGLQVGDQVYPDVVLLLRKSGRWNVESVGLRRSVTREDFLKAALLSPVNATITSDWRPADARIRISRLHIDTRVYGDVVLHLSGDSWAWETVLQELSALTLKDFKANSSLVATESHHVVLRSAPETGTQSFPLQLATKTYKFCMDAQDVGADTLQLLDAAGQEVFSLKAGAPCIDFGASTGIYTMRHTYGGSGSKRTIFVHHAAPPPVPMLASARAAAPRVRAASDPSHPEYWAVYDTRSGNYLSFTGANDIGGNVDPTSGYRVAFGCRGQIQPVAQISPYFWPWDSTTRTRYLFDAANFFEVTRYGDGSLSTFGLPYYCTTSPASDGSGKSVDPQHHTYALDYQTYRGGRVSLEVSQPWPEPLWVAPLAFNPSNPAQSQIADAGQFTPITLSIASYSDRTSNPSDNSIQLLSSQIIYGLSPALLTQLTSAYDVGIWGFYQPPEIRVGFRYFPNGMPASMADSGGAWKLAVGEMAMFSGANCTGAAMVSEGISLPYPQPTVPIDQLSILGGFMNSLQLGPQTTATVYTGYEYQGTSHLFNQSGCVRFADANFAPGSIRLGTDSVTILTQTDRCEYCNLAGVDMQKLDLSAGVKLQHANLTGAQLSNSNLSNADLRFATLQGAKLNYANLESANLCHATLNASNLGVAASLSGAHLKNANLSGANLDGSDFSYASFYSATPQSCQPACDTYAKPTCASAYRASMDSTRFANAYLAGVDMSGTRANGASFSGALLFGTSFRDANLNRNAATGAATDFSFAFLQGADFTNAQVQNANFTSAYVDSDPSASCIQTNLNNEYTGFPGLTVANASGACVAGTQFAPTCIQYVYASAHRPATDASNGCPNGAAGPCSDAAWISPITPLANSSHTNSSCTVNPLCDGFAVPLNTCW